MEIRLWAKIMVLFINKIRSYKKTAEGGMILAQMFQFGYKY